MGGPAGRPRHARLRGVLPVPAVQDRAGRLERATRSSSACSGSSRRRTAATRVRRRRAASSRTSTASRSAGARSSRAIRLPETAAATDAWKARGEDPHDPDGLGRDLLRDPCRAIVVAACTRVLARAAVDFARERGARALEAYPMITEPGRRDHLGRDARRAPAASSRRPGSPRSRRRRCGGS